MEYRQSKFRKFLTIFNIIIFYLALGILCLWFSQVCPLPLRLIIWSLYLILCFFGYTFISAVLLSVYFVNDKALVRTIGDNFIETFEWDDIQDVKVTECLFKKSKVKSIRLWFTKGARLFTDKSVKNFDEFVEEVLKRVPAKFQERTKSLKFRGHNT